MTVCASRPPHDVIYLDAIGGPAAGERAIPFAMRGITRQAPDPGDQVKLIQGTLTAIYVWSPVDDAYVCRHIEDHA